MNNSLVLCILLAFALSQAVRIEAEANEPTYNYRYQTEEMKTSASEIPYHNYRVYEDGYYPGGYDGGYQRSFPGIGGKYLGGQFGGGYYPGYKSYAGPSYNGGGGYTHGGGYSRGGGYPHGGGYSYGGGIGAGGIGAGGIGAGGIGAGGIGAGGIGAGGIGAGGIGVGGGGAAFYPHGGVGGGFVDKKIYSGENKNVNGESFEKSHGNKGEQGQQGSEGFSQGQVAVKDVKGDSGFYNDQQGAKKVYDDGKSYQGGQQFSQAGGAGQGVNQKENHKNGHVKKGFKTSHHKDESGSEETFYDEAHDEGDKYNYQGNQGTSGANGQSNYKGGHENGQFAADARSKQGQYDRQHIVDNSNADKGQYGQKGYHGSGESFSVNNGIGQQSLLGRQEANRLYVNNHPHGYVPVYSEY